MRHTSITLALLWIAAVAGAATGSDPARNFAEAVSEGAFSLNVRARWEHADQSGRLASDALTVRTRLGFATAPLAGFKAFAEVEDITALDSNAYNQAGLNPSAASRTVVADPETTELNRAWLEWADARLRLRAGRQEILLDNVRFVGDVGWRQNQQTFDALLFTLAPSKPVAVTYAYIDEVRRVFGRKHPQGRWKSDSHLFNASVSDLPVGKLTGYAYLLDFANAPASSSATVGASLAGSRPVGDSKQTQLTWRLEYARQRDYANQPVDYSTGYRAIEFGAKRSDFGASLLWEVLESDNGRGFATPLATLHAHNGWADAFLTTPAGGLRDIAASLHGKLPGAVKWRAVWHDYALDRGGAALGNEWDLQASRAFGKRWVTLVKFAGLDGRSGIPDVRKFWIEVVFNL